METVKNLSGYFYEQFGIPACNKKDLSINGEKKKKYQYLHGLLEAIPNNLIPDIEAIDPKISEDDKLDYTDILNHGLNKINESWESIRIFFKKKLANDFQFLQEKDITDRAQQLDGDEIYRHRDDDQIILRVRDLRPIVYGAVRDGLRSINEFSKLIPGLLRSKYGSINLENFMQVFKNLSYNLKDIAKFDLSFSNVIADQSGNGIELAPLVTLDENNKIVYKKEVLDNYVNQNKELLNRIIGTMKEKALACPALFAKVGKLSLIDHLHQQVTKLYERLFSQEKYLKVLQQS